jgi:hypothetical protein
LLTVIGVGGTGKTSPPGATVGATRRLAGGVYFVT